MTKVESFGHFDRVVFVNEDGPQDFVVALFTPDGLQKELLASVPIHREPPCDSVIPFSTENTNILRFSPRRFQGPYVAKALKMMPKRDWRTEAPRFETPCRITKKE
jgi:hypothetical protein